MKQPGGQRQSISLFSGCGGLDLGLERAGFAVAACIEIDTHCRSSLDRNTSWPLIDVSDIRKLPPSRAASVLGVAPGEIDLVAGGPPCQPFSKAGQWVNGSAPGLRHRDGDTLQAFLDVVGSCLPSVMLLENVQGLLASNRARGDSDTPFDIVVRSLKAINRAHGTSYIPRVMKLDAADYGVPQHRERLFVLASRDGIDLKPPVATHGPRSGSRNPYVTAWDALGDLEHGPMDPSLLPTGKWSPLLATIPEGCNYQFHTARGDGEPIFGYRTKFWSFLLKLAKDRPSWTLPAQPGPATGPFHWNSRRLSVREMARLQTFPDTYEFAGSYRSAHKQIGNAVPVVLGEALGTSIQEQVWSRPTVGFSDLVPPSRKDCPPPVPPAPIPESFLHLRGAHPDHPGHGLGPAASLWTA